MQGRWEEAQTLTSKGRREEIKSGTWDHQADRSRAGIEARKAIVKGCQSHQPPSENSDQNLTV